MEIKTKYDKGDYVFVNVDGQIVQAEIYDIYFAMITQRDYSTGSSIHYGIKELKSCCFWYEVSEGLIFKTEQEIKKAIKDNKQIDLTED